jgi:hypothetical protein
MARKRKSNSHPILPRHRSAPRHMGRCSRSEDRSGRRGSRRSRDTNQAGSGGRICRSLGGRWRSPDPRYRRRGRSIRRRRRPHSRGRRRASSLDRRLRRRRKSRLSSPDTLPCRSRGCRVHRIRTLPIGASAALVVLSVDQGRIKVHGSHRGRYRLKHCIRIYHCRPVRSRGSIAMIILRGLFGRSGVLGYGQGCPVEIAV